MALRSALGTSSAVPALGLLILSGCSGALTGGIGAIGSQIPGALNIPTSVCVATITQEMQTLGQLKAAINGAPVPIAP